MTQRARAYTPRHMNKNGRSVLGEVCDSLKRALYASKGKVEKMSEMQQYSNDKAPRHVVRALSAVNCAAACFGIGAGCLFSGVPNSDQKKYLEKPGRNDGFRTFESPQQSGQSILTLLHEAGAGETATPVVAHLLGAQIVSLPTQHSHAVLLLHATPSSHPQADGNGAKVVHDHRAG